jgi:hypothetical protein
METSLDSILYSWMILEERSSHVGRSTKLADLVTSLIFFNLNDAMMISRIRIQGLEQEFVKQNFDCLLLFVKVFDRHLWLTLA